MTATTSPPETLEPSGQPRKRKEIDPEHDIDAKKTIVWLITWTLAIFASLWLLLQLFKVVMSGERGSKIETVQPADLDALRRSEEILLDAGTKPDGSPRMSIEDAMRELVGR